ncbi:MAG: aminoglycoside phosphotransferase family protein [Saprospiraceae bacterium]|nr:aminoglycoside phosphotransferase family protein [Saprospiraceae bacterium]
MPQLEAIAARFFEFERLSGAVPLGKGNINDTYRLDLERSGQTFRFVLQRLNHLVFRQPEQVMDNTLRVCRYLAAQEYPYQLASPLATREGTFLHRDEAGNYWRAFPFIPASFAPEGLSDPSLAYEAARAYGAFARALRDFPAAELNETIPGFHDTDRRWDYFLQITSENPADRVRHCQQEIAALYQMKELVFDRISLLKKSGELPLRVVHNDTKAGNVLFDETTRKALAVIDLDTVMPGTLLSDFGDMVRTFAPHVPEDDGQIPSIRTDVLEALTQGFLEQTSDILMPAERDYLLFGGVWMAGEQALRFLSDYFAGDVYFKIRNEEHNLLRARNQIALFEALLTFQNRN